LRAELAKDKIAWEASTVAAAAEVQVAMKRNADEEARLTGERCEVMDERAELEAMGKDLKRDAELLCEEREVFESENEALKHKVAEVMKLGQQVEGQSEALRLRHREAEEKHVEATHRLLLAKEAKRNSDEELALAEQHRERGEALKKQHEQERIEMAQMRLKFTSEKWAEPRGGGGGGKGPGGGGGAGGKRRKSLTTLQPVMEMGANAAIKAQLAAWEREREETSNYIKSASNNLGSERILSQIHHNQLTSSLNKSHNGGGSKAAPTASENIMANLNNTHNSSAIGEALSWVDTGLASASASAASRSVNWPEMVSLDDSNDVSTFSAVPFKTSQGTLGGEKTYTDTSFGNLRASINIGGLGDTTVGSMGDEVTGVDADVIVGETTVDSDM